MAHYKIIVEGWLVFGSIGFSRIIELDGTEGIFY